MMLKNVARSKQIIGLTHRITSTSAMLDGACMAAVLSMTMCMQLRQQSSTWQSWLGCTEPGVKFVTRIFGCLCDGTKARTQEHTHRVLEAFGCQSIHGDLPLEPVIVGYDVHRGSDAINYDVACRIKPESDAAVAPPMLSSTVSKSTPQGNCTVTQQDPGTLVNKPVMLAA